MLEWCKNLGLSLQNDDKCNQNSYELDPWRKESQSGKLPRITFGPKVPSDISAVGYSGHLGIDTKGEIRSNCYA